MALLATCQQEMPLEKISYQKGAFVHVYVSVCLCVMIGHGQ